MNATMAKFGYPANLVADEGGWVALVRPSQTTLGSMVLVCKEAATAFGAVGPDGFAALRQAVARTELALKAAFGYDKINYLMLMMVDPDVHFHVIPRYATERTFAGQTFRDAFWPKPPDLTIAADPGADTLAKIRDHIRAHWPNR